jgi:signal transduction histidine kinase
MWFSFRPVFLAAFLLLPLVIFDIIRFSNRFVGPILRLRRSMRQLARGEHVEPIKFRGTDFWQDFADEFNAVLARVQDRTAEVDKFAPENKAEPVAVTSAY